MAKVGRFVKEAMLQELTNRLSERPNFFVASLGRLPASEADRFRQQLSASKARLIMVKRRLGLRAIEQLKLSDAATLLQGSIGLILSGADVLPTAKVLVEFVKSHAEQVSVRGGVIDGQLLDTARVQQLASLPSRPVLLAEVIFTIESPMADVIFTIERLIGDIAWIAEQAAAAKPQASPAATTDAAPQPTTEAGTPPAGGVAEGSPDAGGAGTPQTHQTPTTEEGKSS